MRKYRILILVLNPENYNGMPPGFEMWTEIAEGFNELGHEAEIVYAESKIAGDNVRNYVIDKKPDVFLTSAYYGWNIFDELQEFFVENNIIYANALEVYWAFYEELNSKNKNHVLLHLDAELKRFAEFIAGDNIAHRQFRWPAINTKGKPVGHLNKTGEMGEDSRPIDVLWVGRFRFEQAERVLRNYPKSIYLLADEVADKVWRDTTRATGDQCLKVLKHTEEFIPKVNSEFFFDFMCAVDLLSRAKRRVNVLAELRGLNVHIVSNADIEQPGFVWHEEMDWCDVRKLIQKAKIFICDGPNHSHCVNDRALNGMLDGALCLTQLNHAMAHEFVDLQTACLFDLRERGMLRSRINYFLDRPDERAAIVEAAQSEIQANHGCDKTVQDLIAVFDGIF